ncbi:MAG: c-type cytochrome [Candidatus Acidiferrales bacterium]|jgi:mono/diheme cytochrome c family protein
MRVIVRVVLALILLCFTVSAQEAAKPAPATSTPAAESKVPPEAAKLPNPVKPTPASLAQGKKSYGYDCALCHGKDGDGKGDLADDMKLKLADYRDPAALKDMTDGEMFYIIKNGKGEMTGEGDRVKTDEIWDLVNYVRSFAKKGPPPPSAPSKPPGS